MKGKSYVEMLEDTYRVVLERTGDEKVARALVMLLIAGFLFGPPCWEKR